MVHAQPFQRWLSSRVLPQIVHLQPFHTCSASRLAPHLVPLTPKERGITVADNLSVSGTEPGNYTETIVVELTAGEGFDEDLYDLTISYAPFRLRIENHYVYATVSLTESEASFTYDGTEKTFTPGRVVTYYLDGEVITEPQLLALGFDVDVVARHDGKIFAEPHRDIPLGIGEDYDFTLRRTVPGVTRCDVVVKLDSSNAKVGYAVDRERMLEGKQCYENIAGATLTVTGRIVRVESAGITENKKKVVYNGEEQTFEPTLPGFVYYLDDEEISEAEFNALGFSTS